jgi:hypothetical protein
MLKSIFISVYFLLNLNSFVFAQGSGKVFAFAYITMVDDLTIFSDIQEIFDVNDEKSVKLFKVNSRNEFANFLIKRSDINYLPKLKDGSGVTVVVIEGWSEANRIYQEKRKLSGDSHYVVEGFQFFNPNSSSKTELIRN